MPSHQLLDLALALASRRADQLVPRLGSQVGAEEPHGGDAEGAFGELVEDERKAADGTRDLDAIVGGVLRQAQDRRAVHKE